MRIRVLQNDFARIARDLRPALQAVVAETAVNVSGDAKQRAPVRTGNLRRSIITRHHGGLLSIVSSDVEYGPYVEYGTSKMPARPFLLPALEANRARFEERVRSTIARLV